MAVVQPVPAAPWQQPWAAGHAARLVRVAWQPVASLLAAATHLLLDRLNAPKLGIQPSGLVKPHLAGALPNELDRQAGPVSFAE